MTKGALEDKFAFEEFSKLIQKFEIKKIIETGTYHGWSTLKLSEFGIPTISIELSEENYKISLNKLEEKKIKNVELILGSSSEVLKIILSEEDNQILLFLDAHWHNYWPIHDELNVCIEKKIKPIIVIHDFFVPNEFGSAKFGYDKYNGQSLDFNYIENHLNEIYGLNGYDYHYTDKIESVDSGLIYIYPKLSNGNT